MQTKNTKKIYKHLFNKDFQDILYLKIILKNIALGLLINFFKQKHPRNNLIIPTI